MISGQEPRALPAEAEGYAFVARSASLSDLTLHALSTYSDIAGMAGRAHISTRRCSSPCLKTGTDAYNDSESFTPKWNQLNQLRAAA